MPASRIPAPRVLRSPTEPGYAIGFRAPETLIRRLDDLVVAERSSRSAVIRAALERHLDEQQPAEVA